jgi:hypothetical protein
VRSSKLAGAGSSKASHKASRKAAAAQERQEEAYDEELDLDTYEDDDVHGYEVRNALGF